MYQHMAVMLPVKQGASWQSEDEFVVLFLYCCPSCLINLNNSLWNLGNLGSSKEMHPHIGPTIKRQIVVHFGLGMRRLQTHEVH